MDVTNACHAPLYNGKTHSHVLKGAVIAAPQQTKELVNDMAKARFLGIWRFNPNAPWPIDPTEAAQLNEMIFAQIDNALQTGGMLEMGFFLDGTSGYTMGGGESTDAFRRALAPFPFVLVDVHEIVDYETGKGIMREMLKRQAEAMRR